MTRPLRQRHRRTIAVLALALPMAFIAAILARRPIPVASAGLIGAPVSDPARSLNATNRAGSETGAPPKP